MQKLNLFEFSEKNKPKRFIKVADLKPINNLKLIFREIRDYFAGNVTGITRDEKIAQNIMRLLFCKIYDEKNSKGQTEFSNRPDEDLGSFKERISLLFEKVKKDYSDIFEKNEKLEIQAEQLSFIVSKLEDYSVLSADRDVIGDAFEELIGTSFRGGEGQFFTPRNVVQMMIDVLQPKNGEKIIDPACGSGGFLAYTIRFLLANKKNDFQIAGIDKDSFLAKIAKIYLSLIGDQDCHIHCENSLESPTKWGKDTQTNIKLGEFDVVRLSLLCTLLYNLLFLCLRMYPPIYYRISIYFVLFRSVVCMFPLCFLRCIYYFVRLVCLCILFLFLHCSK